MMITNFTPDPIPWMHVGQIGILEPGQVQEFDDKRGKHILNKFMARGVLRISHGDDENEKKAEAMEIYNRFWARQFSNFNQFNESLKNENKPYVHPGKELEKKAEEFKAELVGPWKVTPTPTGDKEIQALKGEMSEMKSMIGDLLKSTSDANTQRDTVLRGQFTNLPDGEFADWLNANLGDVRTWPAHIQSEVEVKWTETQGDEMYPLTT